MDGEAQAQSRFLAALLRQSPAIAGAKALHVDSLQAYRGNVSASVTRALAAIHPTVQQHLGEEDFNALAQLYLADYPPQRGDWAQYGGQYAHWLRSCNPGGVTVALPFLPDMAALDAARYHAEAAADAKLDAASLGALVGDATQLTIVLHPAVSVLDGDYDVSAAAFEAPPERLPSPHALLVWRTHWRAQTARMSVCEAAFVRFCLRGATIHAAVQQAIAVSRPETPFDFASWLTQALQRDLIVRIAESTPTTVSTTVSTPTSTSI